MWKSIVLLVLAVAGWCGPACAQTITGQWQTSYFSPATGRETWFILDISREKGRLSARRYELDSTEATAASTVTFDRRRLAVSIGEETFTGEMSADGGRVAGQMTAAGASFPVAFDRATKATAWPFPPKPHAIQTVTMDDGVKLEVVDWGGSGRPILFLSGMTATAHVFDAFAPQLKSRGHVYGVTRRGWGVSDKPDPGAGGDYTTERLGKDVLAVIEALKLDKPVLAGWSYGGAEMSYVAAHAPEKVAGLVYLDGGYAYAFYAPGNYEPRGANLTIDANDLSGKVARALAAQSGGDAAAIIRDMLETNLPQLEADLRAAEQVLREDPDVWRRPQPTTLRERITAAVAAGYTKLPAPKVPVLAIFADPIYMFPGMTPAEQEAYRRSQARASEVVKRFEAGNPGARIVRLPNTRHAVFMFAGPDVLREMNAFIDGLR